MRTTPLTRPPSARHSHMVSHSLLASTSIIRAGGMLSIGFPGRSEHFVSCVTWWQDEENNLYIFEAALFFYSLSRKPFWKKIPPGQIPIIELYVGIEGSHIFQNIPTLSSQLKNVLVPFAFLFHRNCCLKYPSVTSSWTHTQLCQSRQGNTLKHRAEGSKKWQLEVEGEKIKQENKEQT